MNHNIEIRIRSFRGMTETRRYKVGSGRKCVGRNVEFSRRQIFRYGRTRWKGLRGWGRVREKKVIVGLQRLQRLQRLSSVVQVSWIVVDPNMIVVDPSMIDVYSRLMEEITSPAVVDRLAREGLSVDNRRSFVMGVDGVWHIGIGRIQDLGLGRGIYYAEDGLQVVFGANSSPITYIGPNPAYGVASIELEIQPGMWLQAKHAEIKISYSERVALGKPSVTELVKVVVDKSLSGVTRYGVALDLLELLRRRKKVFGW